MIVNDPSPSDLAQADTLVVSKPSKDRYAPTATAASTAGSTGIIVLSSILRVLYINQRARTFVAQLVGPDSSSTHESGLPSPLIRVSLNLCSRLSAAERSREDPTLISECWAHTSIPQVKVEGLALPGPGGMRDARIVLLLR